MVLGGGACDGAGVACGDGEGVGVGLGVGEGVGAGVGVGDGAGFPGGVGVGEALGDGDGEGVGEGRGVGVGLTGVPAGRVPDGDTWMRSGRVGSSSVTVQPHAEIRANPAIQWEFFKRVPL